MDSKIKFQVEGISDIKFYMNQILRDATAQAKVLSDSNSSMVKSLQFQITLLKERNKIAGQYPGGSVNITGAGSGLSIAFESNIQNLVVELAKLNDILRKTGRLKPSTQPPVNPTSQASPNQSSTRGGVNANWLQSFALTNMINPLTGRDPLTAGLNVSGNIGSSLMMTGGKLGWIGALIAGATGVGAMQIDLLKDIAPSAARNARILGGRYSDYFNYGTNKYADIGVNRSGYLEGQGDVSTSLGKRDAKSLNDFLVLQKGYNFSSEDLLSLLKANRSTRGFSLGGSISGLMGGMKMAGLSDESSSILVPEYLRVLVELSQKQVETLGNVNTNVSTGLISAVAGTGEKFKNPVVLKSVVESIYAGLQTAKSPQLEALQFQALSRTKGGGSLWQLEMMRENPLSQGTGYLTNYIDSLKKNSSTQDDFARNLSVAFGLKKVAADELSKSYGSGDFQRNLISATKSQGPTQEEFYSKAISAANQFEVLTAAWENTKMGPFTEKVEKGIEKIIQLMEGQERPILKGQGPVQSALFQLALPSIAKLF